MVIEAVESFSVNINILKPISYAVAIIVMACFCFRRYKDMDKGQLILNAAVLGFLCSGVSAGVISVLAVFFPELRGNLSDFSKEIGIWGCAYIIFVVITVVEKFKK